MAKPPPAPRAAGDLRVEYVAPAELKPHPKNARKHTRKQLDALKTAIERFGFLFPVAVDAENQLIAGHGRVLAAAELGMDRIPAIRHAKLTAAEVRALLVLDNRLAEMSEWDKIALNDALVELPSLDLDLATFGLEPPAPAKAPGRASIVDAPLVAAFWITAEGPLLVQADALAALKALAKLPGVTVHSNLKELGL